MKKIPKGSEAVYARVDENRLYWVKGNNTPPIIFQNVPYGIMVGRLMPPGEGTDVGRTKSS